MCARLWNGTLPFSPLNSAESISAPEMPLRKAVALVFSGAESMSMQQQRDFPGSFANVGVVKSICKQVQTAAYQGSNHGISATGGFTSHGYSCRNRVSFVN